LAVLLVIIYGRYGLCCGTVLLAAKALVALQDGH
jgi:hypothetical protein